MQVTGALTDRDGSWEVFDRSWMLLSAAMVLLLAVWTWVMPAEPACVKFPLFAFQRRFLTALFLYSHAAAIKLHFGEAFQVSVGKQA